MRPTIRWHCRQFAAAINFFALSKTLPPAESCATVQFEDRTPPLGPRNRRWFLSFTEGGVNLYPTDFWKLFPVDS
jgi:hypothetical protein